MNLFQKSYPNKNQVTRGKKLMSRQSWANNVISEAHVASTCTRPGPPPPLRAVSFHRKPQGSCVWLVFFADFFLVSESYLQNVWKKKLVKKARTYGEDATVNGFKWLQDFYKSYRYYPILLLVRILGSSLDQQKSLVSDVEC